MEQKKKVIVGALLVAVIIAALVGLFVFYHKQQPTSQAGQAQQQVVQNQSSSDQQKNNSDKNSIPEVVALHTKVASGDVATINDHIINVKVGNENIALNALNDVSVYVIQKEKIVAKNFADLKMGEKIMFEYDEKTNNAIAIKIISNQ